MSNGTTDLVLAAAEANTAPPKPENSREKILYVLNLLGGSQQSEDELVFAGTKFILPAQYEGKTGEAIKFLRTYQEQMEEEHNFDRVFKYRPNDVAAALIRALKQIWGTSGIGQATYSFFGKQNPTFRTIDVGLGETLQVPEGWTAFPPIDGRIAATDTNDEELGSVGFIRIEAPRKYRGAVEGLFIAIENQLKTGSIYRGKAIDGKADPNFMDLSTVDPSKVVYTQEVLNQLNANVWVLLEHTEKMRQHGIPLKRTALLEGPYGTGKSLAAFLTAQKAVANDWTFLYCRPGDDLKRTMRTAQMYAPAVVFFEDVDTVASTDDQKKISELLDTFDGIANKGLPLVGILTTNNVEQIHKGMLRPGRMDAVIHIGALDRDGIEKLIKSLIRDVKLEVDYDQVYQAYEGFMPAFAAEAIGRVTRFAIARNFGDAPDLLTTADFVDAAVSLRSQLDLMEGAREARPAPTIDQAFEIVAERMAAKVQNQTELVDRDGDKVLSLRVEDNK